MPHSAHSDMNFWLLTNIGGFRSDYPVSNVTDIITVFGSHFREKNWKWKWRTFFRPFSSLLVNTFHSLSRWACLFMGFTLSTWLSYIQLENVKDFLSSRQTKNSRLHRCVTRSRYGLFLPMQCNVQTKKITNWLQDKANEACFYLWSLIRWTSDVYGGWVTCLVNGIFQFEPSQKEARSESWSAPRLDPTTNISKHRGLQGATMTTDSMRSFNLFLYYEWAICLLYLKEYNSSRPMTSMAHSDLQFRTWDSWPSWLSHPKICIITDVMTPKILYGCLKKLQGGPSRYLWILQSTYGVCIQWKNGDSSLPTLRS